MSTLPAANYLTDSARTEGEFKAGLEAMLASTKQIPGAGVAELAITIAAGSITPAGSGGALVIDTESSAATDDLTNIVQTNYPDDSMILLRNANAARFVVCKHAATGAGQLLLARNADYVLDDTKKFLLLQRRGTDWYEVYRAPGRLSMPTVTKNADFTINREDHGKIFLVTGEPITVSFEAAALLGDGFCVGVVNTTNGSSTGVTLNPNASETVDSRVSLSLYGRQGVLLVCDGTKLVSIGDRQKPTFFRYNYASALLVNSSDGHALEVNPLTGNISTFTVEMTPGERIRIRFIQDGTGGRTVANPSGAKITGSIDATANKVSYLDLYHAVGDLRLEGFWSTVPV